MFAQFLGGARYRHHSHGQEALGYRVGARGDLYGFVEFIDDRTWCALGNEEAEPRSDVEAIDALFGNRRHIWQLWTAFQAGHAERAKSSPAKWSGVPVPGEANDNGSFCWRA